jgi:hypothetical protein
MPFAMSLPLTVVDPIVMITSSAFTSDAVVTTPSIAVQFPVIAPLVAPVPLCPATDTVRSNAGAHP